MKKFASLAAALFLLAALAGGASAQSKEEKKQMLIKAAQVLEADPFGDKAKDIRAWAVAYVIETDEVSIVVCGGDLMKPVLDKKNKNSTELVGQYTIAMAAFKLANPAANGDENAAQLAGLESMLRAYEAMIKAKPKTQFAGMDELLAKRASGALKTEVYAADCGKKSGK